MRPKLAALDRAKALGRLVEIPAARVLPEAAQVVAANRKLIRKAMRMGHGLETLSRELQLPKRTLQRHLNDAGLFFRKPRVKKGTVIRPTRGAIYRAKAAALANV